MAHAAVDQLPHAGCEHVDLRRRPEPDGLGRRFGVNEPLTIAYLQGGPRGQGKIGIEADEVERIKQAMRVAPQYRAPLRHMPSPRSYPGITVPLGRPPH